MTVELAKPSLRSTKTTKAISLLTERSPWSRATQCITFLESLEPRHTKRKPCSSGQLWISALKSKTRYQFIQLRNGFLTRKTAWSLCSLWVRTNPKHLDSTLTSASSSGEITAATTGLASSSTYWTSKQSCLPSASATRCSRWSAQEAGGLSRHLVLL